jgi:hypothetical protein
MAGFQQVGECFFVNQTAAGTVDDTHAGLGLFKVLAAEDIRRLLGEGNMEGDEMGAFLCWISPSSSL